jgi:peptidoglycan/LPS O-acetylase OafA/YrhL
MRGRLARGDRLALALALAASAVAGASLVLSLAGDEGAAAPDFVFAVLAALGGAACLAAWRAGDRADRRRRPLRALGAMMLAVTAFTLARVAGDPPWRELLQGGGVLIIAALVVTLRRAR